MLLYALLVIAALLIDTIVVKPAITSSVTGKMLAFIAFCILPVLCGSMAAVGQDFSMGDRSRDLQ